MAETTNKGVLRFSLARRIEHWINFVSFATLVATGVPQKYPEAVVSQTIVSLFGGLETARLIHRGSAITLILISIWHIGTIIYHSLVLRGPATMGLGKDDATNAWKAVKYNLKLSDDKPKQGFYTFEEKAEYYALLWGTLVMIITGAVLWNPILATNIMPAAWIPAAKAAHGGEALLAALAIVLWHFYHVLVKHFNKSMYTGYLSKEEMEDLHPIALEQTWEPPAKDDPARKRRERFFLITYGIAGVLMLFGVIWFVTVETTAVKNPDPIPDISNINNYSPLVEEDASIEVPDIDVTEIGTSWDDGLGEIINIRCGRCHREGEGGIHDLHLTTYEGAMAGGESGPSIIPGQPGTSPLLIWPQIRDHPETFETDQFYAISQWISNGAEK